MFTKFVITQVTGFACARAPAEVLTGPVIFPKLLPHTRDFKN